MIEAALVGLLAGVVAGMLGVGGGILFVPALTIGLGLSQVEAEATSLLAVVPVALIGAWRQEHYGNVALKEAAVIGALSGLRRARRRRAGQRAAHARAEDRVRRAAAAQRVPAQPPGHQVAQGAKAR